MVVFSHVITLLLHIIKIDVWGAGPEFWPFKRIIWHRWRQELESGSCYSNHYNCYYLRTYPLVNEASYSCSAGISLREGTNAYIVIRICNQSRKVLPRLIFGTTNPSPDLPVLFFRAFIIRKCHSRLA